MIRTFSISHHAVTSIDSHPAALDAIDAAHAMTTLNVSPGAGKLALLAQARVNLETGGCDVIGCALTGKAADTLQSSSGIRSCTIARLIGQLEQHPTPLRISKSTVVVVDEPGLIGFDDVSRLTSHVARAEGRVLLVGDLAGERE